MLNHVKPHSMDTQKNIPRTPREFGKKNPDKSTKIALLTPGQKRIFAYPVIQEMTRRFGLDWNTHSSLAALDTIKISHAVESLFAKLSGTTPPPPLDLSNYAPLSPTEEKILRDRQHQKKLTSLPPGLTIDQNGNTTFDNQWKQKGIHPTQLPQDHPDWTPF